MTRSRRLAAALPAPLWLLITAGPVLADPAGPSDYLTRVIRVEPAISGLHIDIIGGDSFIMVKAGPAMAVEVPGYRGEPYLRFLPGGTVEENENSPTTHLNLDRYGEGDMPPHASYDAGPQWRVVAGDGAYAWHDHRAHWMSPSRPPGKGPGDVILEGVIPLRVDGQEVLVTVQSVWQPAPSALPAAAGVMAALALLMATVAIGGGIRVPAAITGLLGMAAAALGLVAYLSVPAVTGPSWSLWVPPMGAAALAGVVALSGPSARFSRAHGFLMAAASLQIAAWALLHREWMWRAVLPTAAPSWLHRGAVATALVGGIGMLIPVSRSRAASDPSRP